MTAKKKESGPVAFESWYSGLFGDRWPTLKSALSLPATRVSWDEGLIKPYFLDAGSVEAALSLPAPPPGGRIIDMCAAPGGKTLVLTRLVGDGSVLVSNEFSRDRRRRLATVLEEHLDPAKLPAVTVTGYDAAKWAGHERAAADRILLDAPCSSERHVLASSRHLAEWTPARIRNLAQRQWALLSAAWLVLAPGGILVYATCALSPEENDGVVSRLMKKYGDEAVPAEYRSSGRYPELRPERTEFGVHILPDTSGGAGPMYMAILAKKAAAGERDGSART